MGSLQSFVGALELVDPSRLERLVVEVMGDDARDSGAVPLLKQSLVTDRILLLDIHVNQPDSFFLPWKTLLFELAHHSWCGGVAAIRRGETVEVETAMAPHRTDRPVPKPHGRTGIGFPLRAGTEYALDANVRGRAFESTWTVVEEPGGAVSIRMFDNDAYNDWLGTMRLTQRGSAVYDVDSETPQPWLDAEAPPGEGWIRRHPTSDTIRLVRLVDVVDVELPSGLIRGCRHYEQRMLDLSPEHLECQDPKTMVGRPTSIYIARELGIIKVENAMGSFVRKQVSPEAKGWGRLARRVFGR